MRLDSQKILGILAAFSLVALAAPSAAYAQAAVLDDDDDTPGDKKPSEDIGGTDAAAAGARFGIGLRIRQVFVPRAMIELFVERAEGGHSHTGFGLELIRRKGDFELSLGVEYESLSGNPGVFIDKGEAPPADEVDYVEYEDFGWVGADVTFAWHSKLNEKLALRYGAGLGLGVILGDVVRTDYVCATSDLGTCVQKPGGENVRTPYADVPPVFPIVNILLGAQFRPVENVAINLEGGMRTAFYFGLTGAYFF